MVKKTQSFKVEAKAQFRKHLSDFVQSMHGYLATREGQWKIKGLIDVDHRIFPLSSDTKLLSKIIELHLLPEIFRFAEKSGYQVVLPDHQNHYPDLSIIAINDESVKFAVDIKTTYRDDNNPNNCNGFTLGSHGAYFINRTAHKNITFPYGEYLAHYCFGIIYSRHLPRAHSNEPFAFKDLHLIESVVKSLQLFVCEKWELASDKSGSGNTANIGSIKKIDDIIRGNGVFKKLGEKWFDEYWQNYGKVTDEDGKKITTIERYLKFRGKKTTLVNRAKRIAPKEKKAK